MPRKKEEAEAAVLSTASASALRNRSERWRLVPVGFLLPGLPLFRREGQKILVRQEILLACMTSCGFW
jgi:hypothetical protein